MSLRTAVRSEFTKLLTTPGWWMLGVALAVFVGIVAVVASYALGAAPAGIVPRLAAAERAPAVYSVAMSLGAVFPLLAGIVMVTAEFRHGTLTPTLLATPRRGRLLAAKVAVGAAVGAVYGIVGIAAAAASGGAALAASGVPTSLGDADTWALFARMLGASVLWTLVGLGVGAVVLLSLRSRAASRRDAD